ncbi:MAG: hypothetical protein NZ899_04030 [Thermoguttaceae bacterium]|nr:hypothetical protein [Thermoguttaceae bacterium]MDW8077697.1 hypothetical protein [Thermoguttaceae bacterium]
MGPASKKQSFDPYLVWLGIRDPQRPPNHYRLLGLELFEYDAEVIQNCADRQISYIRRFLTGEHAAEAQQLLQELIAARACLLDPKAKEAYDFALREHLAARAPVPPFPAEVGSISAGASAAEGRRVWGFPLAFLLRWPRNALEKISSSLLWQPASPDGERSPARSSEKAPRPVEELQLIYKYLWTAGYLIVVCALLTLGIVLLQRVPRTALAIRDETSAEEKPSAQPSSELPGQGEKRPAEPTENSSAPPPSTSSDQPAKPLDSSEVAASQGAPSPSGGAQTPTQGQEDQTEALATAQSETPSPQMTAPAGGTKLPVPDQAQILAARTKYEQKVREILSQNADRSAREQLLGQLIDLAGQLEDPAERFALLRAVAESAIEADLAVLLRRAVDQLCATFEIRRSDLVDELLVAADLSARGLEFRRDIARLLIFESGLAADSGDHTRAKSFLEKAQDLAQQAKDQALLQLAADELRLLPLVEDSHRRAMEAQKTLASNPQDPEAHLALGLYLCFFRANPDFAEGFKHLAQGSDEKLRTLAEAEVSASPSLPAREKVALGDRWREASTDAPSPLRARYVARALYWYRLALPDTTGFTRLRLEKLLRELTPQGNPIAP